MPLWGTLLCCFGGASDKGRELYAGKVLISLGIFVVKELSVAIELVVGTGAISLCTFDGNWVEESGEILGKCDDVEAS